MPKQPPHPKNPASTNPRWAAQLFVNGQSPRTWLGVAHRLLEAARVLIAKEEPAVQEFEHLLQRHEHEPVDDAAWEAINMPNFDAAHLLIAYAIENLLKGIIIAKGLVTVTAERLPEELRNHDLCALTAIAQPCAQLREYMLNYLWFTAEWRGRYPTPTRPHEFWPMSSQGEPVAAGIHWNQHPELLAYCNGLEAELDRLIGERERGAAIDLPEQSVNRSSSR